MKDLLRTASLTPDDLTYLLDLAAEQKADPHRHPNLLRGDVVALYFAKPSTRTRFSFEAAVHRLGGSAVTVGPSDLQLGRGETIEDTARTISHFARAFVIRTFAHGDIRCFADAASIPVINALTDLHHPCQSLADLLTLRERFGSLRDLRIAYVGDGDNVAHSLMEGVALAGGHISLGCPAGYEPSPEILAKASEIAAGTGGSVTLCSDPWEAVAGAEAVYTDVWLSMGNDASEREERHAKLAPYQVNEVLLDRATPGAIFMHCLPAHRGDEVTADVMDGPRSVVFDQVENRAHTEQAVLIALLERRLRGTGVL
ncbi:MAG TPA: ornithine carbamoyltransferase [Dehalococcoidia bacterium]|nr:ornithine carbamoyltransferase [Dehalococcoidia bacterium]